MDPMKTDFDYIIQTYGHNILLQRRLPQVSGNSASYSDVLEKHTVRHMFPATRGLPVVQQEKLEGIIHTSERLYYFRGEANPFDGDRIYEYDSISERSNGSTWTIDAVAPMRGSRGQIIYWIAGATRESPN